MLSHVVWLLPQVQNIGTSEPSSSQNLPPVQSLSTQQVPHCFSAGQ
jgi:hypothetical protein